MSFDKKLNNIFEILYNTFGPQHWWPGDSPFEVAVGAILTQNTNWSNVKKAIENLKKYKLLEPYKIYKIGHKKLSELIKSSGYYTIKAKRLKSFIDFLIKEYNGKIESMNNEDTLLLRKKLLSINGIGKETADSILLYAINKPIFVIDTYTKRILSRHGISTDKDSYDYYQNLFHKSLKKDVKLFNEYHALIVKVGKTFCKSKRPLCDQCPLKGI
jgi:endonuclease-3 related protein